MAWLVQKYGREVHVVPDHDTLIATHELSPSCWCQPRQPAADLPRLWSHRDELDRSLARTTRAEPPGSLPRGNPDQEDEWTP